MRLNDDNKTVAAADCLVPGIGEIIGGSQREERLDVLQSRIEELGMKEEDYWWYLDLRRYGSCRHAGFGLGFERMVMYLTGVSNIRDVELHPRTVGNADFETKKATGQAEPSVRVFSCRRGDSRIARILTPGCISGRKMVKFEQKSSYTPLIRQEGLE